MGVGRVTIGTASRNRIGAYAPGRESQADGAATSIRGGYFPSPGWCGWSIKPNGRAAEGVDFMSYNFQILKKNFLGHAKS